MPKSVYDARRCLESRLYTAAKRVGVAQRLGESVLIAAKGVGDL